MQRKNENEVITHDNLITVAKESSSIEMFKLREISFSKRIVFIIAALFLLFY